MPEAIWEIGACGWFYYNDIFYNARSHERKIHQIHSCICIQQIYIIRQ